MTPHSPPDLKPLYSSVRVVGLDADDTLWHSENRFVATHQRYHELLSQYVEVDFDALEQRMLETERRNLALFGYGAKGFTLSLIETAIDITDGAIATSDITTIISFGKDLLDHPVDLLPGVTDAIDALRDLDLGLIAITKGDLWHQESKIAASGLADMFDGVEIVSEKDTATYGRILSTRGIDPKEFCMVGNSVRSDVLPVIELGGSAIHVPYEYLWAHEAVEPKPSEVDEVPTFVTVGSISDVPRLLSH